jgi:hypothetical protein
MIGETSYYSHHAHQNGRSSPATLGNNSKHTHGWMVEKEFYSFLTKGELLPPLVVANDHLKKEMKKKKLTAFWAA